MLPLFLLLLLDQLTVSQVSLVPVLSAAAVMFLYCIVYRYVARGWDREFGGGGLVQHLQLRLSTSPCFSSWIDHPGLTAASYESILPAVQHCRVSGFNAVREVSLAIFCLECL